MPEITDEELARLRQIESQAALSEVNVAKANLRAELPHVPSALIDGFQGDVPAIRAFGETLKMNYPQPVSAAPPQEPPAVPPAAAAPVTTQPTTQPEPDPRELFARQALGNPAPQTAPGGPYSPPQVPALAGRMEPVRPIPQPGIGDAMTAMDAWGVQQAAIREAMAMGSATPAQVRQLAQWGDHGFVAAVREHGAKVRRALGQA